MNKSGEVRLAGYNFYAPLLSEQDIVHPERAVSFLPNSLEAVRNSVQTGLCPKYSAHPWCNYELSKISQNFYPALPLTSVSDRIPRSSLAECLFGFKAWREYEATEEAGLLYGHTTCDNTERRNYLHSYQLNSADLLTRFNDRMESIVRAHQQHIEAAPIQNSDCDICNRSIDSTPEQWIHSTIGVFHWNCNCSCGKCNDMKATGWVPFRVKGGCTCHKCKKSK